MAQDRIDISINGNWISTPMLRLDGASVVVRGKWMKVAAIHDEAWSETELQNPSEFVSKLRRQPRGSFSADIFTFAQKVPGSEPKFAFPMEWDSLAAARFESFEQWWQRLPQETRKNVRRSEKRGVAIVVRPFDEDLIGKIADVNNASEFRQGKRNAHFGKTLKQVKQDHSSFADRSDFICALSGDEAIGYLKVVYRGEVASILNLAAKSSHYDKRPTNALVAKAVELCAAKGISYLTYGYYNYGNKRKSPLREFKDRNGFEEALTPRFYVPLNLWGSCCLKAGFHRGLLAFVPNRAITFAVNSRSKWYNTKGSMSRCSSIAEQPNSNRQTGRSNPSAGSNS
jgi:hypothetical protein